MITLFRFIVRSLCFICAWLFIWIAFFLTTDAFSDELDDFYRARFWKYK